MRFSTKTCLAGVTIAFFVGLAFGWWYRGLTIPAIQSSNDFATEAADQPVTVAAELPLQAIESEPVKHHSDNLQVLSQMLSEQRFLEATALYYQSIQMDSSSKPKLRPTVDAYFQRCFENCEAGTFLDLVDSWLATFYDDIPVLIRLAEFQEQQGQPEAAANTLLLAKTYALLADQQRAVHQARDRLTQRTHERLDGEQRWVELLGYYEFLNTIDLTTPGFELRRALLYHRLGEQSRANRLLTALKKADDGSNPQLTAVIDRYLEDDSVKGTSDSEPVENVSNSVPLEKYGDGFVVRVTLNNRDALRLLLDTGASITALTSDSFRRLYRPDLSLLGSQLFKTASGYTRGDIYRAPTLIIGKQRVDNTNLAVLSDLEMDGVDGLLGMNVLRYFRFEIDRSAGVMYLERR